MAETSTETLHVLGQGRCRYMHAKGMFLGAEPETHHWDSGSGLVWCALTQGCLGPDGQMVDHRECRPGRSCYEGV